MTETPDGTEQKLSGPGAGLSATGRTAGDMRPGDSDSANTYGDPGGTGAADQEVVSGGTEDASVPPEAERTDEATS